MKKQFTLFIIALLLLFSVQNLKAQTSLYWGGATSAYSGAWTTGTPWGTSTSSGATTAWPASGTINAYFSTVGGTVTIPSSISIAPNSVTLNAANTFNTSGAAGALTAPIALGAYTLTTAPASTYGLTLSGIISGTGGLTKTGAGTTTLTKLNTYTGITTISNGTLVIPSGAGIQTGGYKDQSGNVTVNSGGTLELWSWAYGLTNSLGGISTSNANNLYINGGTIQLDNTDATTDRPFTVQSGGATFIAATGVTWGQLSGGSANVYTSGAPMTFGGAGNHTFAQVLAQGTGTLTKKDAGTLTLSGINTYTGATTVNGGTLKAGVATSAFGSGSAVTLANTSGVVLDITGYNNTIGSLTGGGTTGGNVTLGAATLTIGSNNTSPAAYAGAISGTGALIKSGTGTLTLSGTNLYTGTTTISGGTLNVTGSLASGSTVTVNAGYALSGTGTVSGTVNVNGIISPGGSGTGATFTTGAENWNNGGSYACDLTGLTSTACDKLVIGTLATPASGTFTINVNASAISGTFVNTNSYSWTIGTYSGGTPANTYITPSVTGVTLAGSFTVSFSSGNIILNYTPVACAAPNAQPTALTLNPFVNSITVSFTASTGTPAADHYLIVRNTTGTAPSAPNNGTTYSNSTPLGSSTFVAYQTTTSISDAGTTAGTTYYYFIYAANSSSCSGTSPMYATGTALTGNITFTTLTATYNFNSLTAAAINGQDSWVGSYTTATSGPVVAAAGPDGSNCLKNNGAGAGYAYYACKPLSSTFAGFDYQDGSANYTFQFDCEPSYWGGYYVLAYDANGNGSITTDANEKGLGIYLSTGGGQSLVYLPDGTTTNISNMGSIAWYTFQFTISQLGTLNTGSNYGKYTLQYKTYGAGSWTTLISNANLGANPNAATYSNPKNWNYFAWYSSSDGSYGVDNIILGKTMSASTVTLAAPIPNGISTVAGVGSTSASISFQVQGSNLTGSGNLTFTAPSGFQISNDNSTWGSTTTVAYSSANLALSTLYIRFSPSSTTTYSGNITVAGGGITSHNVVAVLGTGITPPPGGYVTNLSLWLNAGKGITTSGSNVTAWNDLSGGAHNYASGTTLPVLTSNGLNNNNVVTFAGAVTTESMSTTDANFANWTVYFVLKGQSNSASTYTNLLGNSTSGNGVIDYNTYSNTNEYGYTTPGTGDYASTLATNYNTAEILRYDHVNTSTNVNIYSQHGGVLQSTALAVGSTTRPIYIKTLQQMYKGYIAEMLVYNAQLTDVTIQKRIESYLAIKYGIALNQATATDYLASDGTTKIWDATANATYKYGIAGIGRDDNSSLAQAKSESINTGEILIMDNGGAFLNDKSYIVWGNDNGSATTYTSSGNTTFCQKITRNWKVAVSGTPGTVSVSFDLTNTGTLYSASNYALLISTSTDFSNATSYTTGTSLNGNILTFTGVTLGNGNIISLGHNYPLSISSQSTASQTQCINGTFTPISVTASGTGTLTYQWFSNTTASTIGGTPLSGNGATSSSYTPQATTAGTLYYYCTVQGCGNTVTSTISGAFIVNPNTLISSQSTASQTQCLNGIFNPITVTASGTGTLAYQWYSNTTASTAGGISLSDNGATTNTYTPQATTNGTLYYYCTVHSGCGFDQTSSISGAFNVNPVAQPTSLTLVPNTGSVAGSFTASSGADSYLILRNTSGIFGSTLPTNGTTYIAGDVTSFPGDTVIAYQTGTSFTDTALNSNTIYYYYVFAVNSSCSMEYLTANPLTNFTTTLNNTPCTYPANPPTFLNLTPAATSISGSFTAAEGGADYYLVVRSTSSSLITAPLNGTVYSNGTPLGGGTVASYQLGSSTSFTDNGLSSATHYYYYIYSVNAICEGGPLYNTTSLNNDTYTNCVTPLAQPTALTFTTTSATISGSFTASVSTDHYLIVRSTSSSLGATPTNGTPYTTGDPIGNGIVLAYQSNTSFTDNGPLNAGTIYYYFVFAGSSNCLNGTHYLASAPLSGNTYLSCVTPTDPPTTLILTPTTISIGGSFTASTSADHYLIVRSTSSTLSATPVNGTTYSTANNLGGGTVIAYQAGISFTDNGPLNYGVDYYYFVFAANSNCQSGPLYLTTSPLIANSYISCTTPANQPTILTLTPTTNSIGGSFTASASVDHYLIVRSTSSAVPTTPINGTTYVPGTSILSTGDSVIAYQTGTTISDLGLIPSTQYYYFIYAANSNCSGGPLYLSTSPLTGNSTTITPPPTISSLGSSQGCIGSTLIINGNYFTGATAVKIGATSVSSFIINSSTLITAVVGNGTTTGTVTVTTPNGTATSLGSFTILANPYTTPPILSGTTTICPGATTNLTFKVTNSNGPFTLTYLPSGGSNTVVSGLYNGSTISVSPTATTNYQVVSVVDANGCVSNGNLITNPSGALGVGTGTGWTFTSTSSGWQVRGGGFCTSTLSEWKSQTVDLVANGYSTTELDAKPIIFVSDQYASSYNVGTYDYYGLLTQLRNSSGTSLTSYSNPSTYTTAGSPIYNSYSPALTSFMTTSNSYSGYNTGVRYVYFEDAGYGPAWAGYYGTVMTNSTVKVYPVVTIGSALAINSQSTASQTTCLNGTFTPISVTATGLNITYQWYSNASASTTGGTALSGNGATTSSYTPQASTAGTLYYYCDVTGCGTSLSSAISGAFIVTNPSVGGIAIATSSPICSGNSTSITLTGYTGTIQWQQSATGTSGWASVTGGSGATTDTYTTPNLTATTYYRAVVTSGACASANSNIAMVTVNNLSVGGIATATSPTICYNGNTSITLTAYNGTIQWEQSANGSTNWTNVNGGSGATTAILTTPNITATTYFRAVVTSGACSSSNSTVATVSFPYPVAQPTDLLLAPGTTTVSGSFTASDADHYLIVRSTNNNLGSLPLNGTIYNANDLIGGGTVVSYQTNTSINDQGLSWNTSYYYFVFATNNQGCLNGPVYLTTSPLTGSTTTTMPLSKTLNVTAMLQGYYDIADNNNLMLQTQDVDYDGNSFNKWSDMIVDTLTIQIRSTLGPDYVIEEEYPTSFINTDGSIILSGSLPYSLNGYHYIVLKHWKSIETWSDSTDFSINTITYNFYNNLPSTEFPNNMTNGVSGTPANGSLIWAGDITDGNGGVGIQDGYVTLDDMFMVYDANLIVLSGYEVLDINGDGYVTLDDMFLVYDNNLVVAQVVNPITLNSKKKK